VILQNGKEVQQIQIQWGEGTTVETSWELIVEIKKAYPQFNLEDKVIAKGKGNVTRQNMAKGKQADMTCDVVNQRLRRSNREKTTSNREKTTSSWKRDFVYHCGTISLSSVITKFCYAFCSSFFPKFQF